MAYVGNPGSNKLVLFESIFRRILQEAAVQPSVAAQQGIALYTFGSGMLTTYVLYGTRGELFEKLRDYSERGGITLSPGSIRGDIYIPVVKEAFIGAMRLVPGSGRDDPATVDGVVAEHGYGPLLYDIALAYNPQLSPDDTVSPAAQDVWRHYQTVRGVDRRVKRKSVPADVLYREPDEKFTKPRVSLKDRGTKLTEVSSLKKAHSAFEDRIENYKQSQVLKGGGGPPVVIDRGAFIEALEMVATDAITTMHM